MFNSTPISRSSGTIISLVLCVCFFAVFWVMAHFGTGFYFDRAHSKGGRVYRVNSYEQFIKQKTGEGTVANVA